MQHPSAPQPTKKWRLILVMFTIVLALLPFWEQQTQQQLSATLEKAVVTFAVARGLNGVISVIQETEISLQPAGVGVGLEPGQILDPLNDLVESFANVMLTTSLVLGSMRILMEVASQSGIKIAIIALGVVWLISHIWLVDKQSWLRLLNSILLVVLALRLFIPVAFLTSEQVSRWVLDDYYQVSTQELMQTQQQMQSGLSVSPAVAASDPSWSDRLSQAYQSTKQLFDVEQQIDNLKQQADHAVEHSIQLMVVFIVRVIVMPLLIGLGFVALLRQLKYSNR